ncbi:hypothetical protein [Aliivibrio kagoshimensis]|uniref:hypothetical protein n=1 Tax=Aliivibrio kagoshimensis TaxID=2910230 RepID=UPI003D1198BE
MSFFDDLMEFGEGALEAVGEQSDWLFPTDDKTSNPAATQQPTQTFADDNGNAVTTPQGSVNAKDNTLLYLGGGIGLLLVLMLFMFAMKK